jgi:hypothetical protein
MPTGKEKLKMLALQQQELMMNAGSMQQVQLSNQNGVTKSSYGANNFNVAGSNNRMSHPQHPNNGKNTRASDIY